MQSIIQPMWKETFSPGKVIIRQGDREGDNLYVCVSGVCEVTKVRPFFFWEKAEGHRYAVLLTSD